MKVTNKETPIGGGTSEILKEIIAKIVIDNKEYKPAT